MKHGLVFFKKKYLQKKKKMPYVKFHYAHNRNSLYFLFQKLVFDLIVIIKNKKKYFWLSIS